MNRIASVLAFVIGAMAVFAGGQVLLGKVPDYYVIDWLPIYNSIMGMVSILLSIVIWKRNRFAMPASVGTLSLHAVVMLTLQTVYRDVVAIDSIVAMTVRMIVWTVIVILLIVQQRKATVRRAIPRL